MLGAIHNGVIMSNKSNKTTIPTVTIESAKLEFQNSLSGYLNAKDALTKAFQAAVVVICGKSKSLAAKQKLRQTLVTWGVEKLGEAKKKTISNTVSALMIANDLAIRHRGPEAPSAAVLQAAAEVLEFCGEHFEDEEFSLAEVLKVALGQARKAGNPAGSEDDDSE